MQHHTQQAVTEMLDDIVSLAVSIGKNENSWNEQCRVNATQDNILLAHKKRELLQLLYASFNAQSKEGHVEHFYRG